MTRAKTYPITIQTWPSGRSFTYRGDPDGPANQRSLRLTARNGGTQEAWRKGTDDDWRTIRIALRAERYAEREILHCDSSLVDELVRAATSGSLPGDLQGFAWDDIENLYPDPSDWDAPTCLLWLDEHTSGPNYRDRAENWDAEVKRFSEYEGRDPDDWNETATDELRNAVRDHAEPAEVLEWWRVSSWLCEQLRAMGEVVIDNNYGYWWGRTCSGQGLIMDGTLQQIAAKFETAEGDHV